MEVGAMYREDGSCRFLLWAPAAKAVELAIEGAGKPLAMMRDGAGYHSAMVPRISLPARYQYGLDGSRLPDPASRFQPEGVHGPSTVVDHFAFQWHDRGWLGMPLERMVIYEIHTGTFTPEGTFSAIEPRLESLSALGVTALELMPVGQFPGERNWGYDQAFPYAVQNSYGGPQELKHLVDSCHQRGLAVILDVVYNHFGPEGSYAGRFGPYFTDRYKTPWGMAINLDGPYCDGVRNFFIENALEWFRHYHIDALRLDAAHAMFDFSATPFLQELSERVARYCRENGRARYLMAESDLNDARLVREPEKGGFGLDAQWSDDFHHSIHGLLTGESQGYYESFGSTLQFARAYENAFAYEGDYSPYRRRRYGSPTADLPARRFVVFCQNHDQAGNRMMGERLAKLTSFEGLKLAAAAVILSPYIPLLFMGEEYGEEAPFLYFTDLGDAGLADAVRAGRAAEFGERAEACPPPDPQGEPSFLASKLRWEFREHGRHGVLLSYYEALLALRRDIPALRACDKDSLLVHRDDEQPGLVEVRRWQGASSVALFFNFADAARQSRPVPDGRWRRLIDSSEMRWLGPGTPSRHIVEGHGVTVGPQSCAVYQREAAP